MDHDYIPSPGDQSTFQPDVLYCVSHHSHCPTSTSDHHPRRLCVRALVLVPHTERKRQRRFPTGSGREWRRWDSSTRR